MSGLRVLSLGAAGLISLMVSDAPALAGSKDRLWAGSGAFDRAQNKFEAAEFEDETFPFMFERKPGLFQWGKPRKDAQHQRRRRSLFQFFDNFDPEPDLTIIQGKPKSPDAGFATYRPVKLVSLSDPKLDAPRPANVIASTLLYELRQPESALRVTEQQRDSIINFYRLNGFMPLWVTSEGLNDKAKRTLSLLSQADEEGLNSVDYLPPTLGAFTDDGSVFRGEVAPLARLDIAMTAMALRYAEHLHSGRIIPDKLSGYYDLSPPILSLGEVLHELSYRVLPDLYLSSLAPAHPAYRLMKASLGELRAKVDQDDDAPIAAGERVKLGGRDARVPLVRARMVKLALLSEEASMAWKKVKPEASVEGAELKKLDQHALEETLDNELSKALKAFQAGQKIKQTGRLDKATVEALNSRSEKRNIQKLVMNMERLRWFPPNPGKRYILVNQAAFELRIMDGNHITWSTKVIVGKPDTQTAVFSDEMETVVMNPYWGVPKSIIKYEMMPYLVNDPSYLDRKGFEVVNARGEVVSSSSVDWWAYGDKIPYDVRQPPGDDNALGHIKFLFPNSHDIYMHDTPTRELFAERVRAFSHGCVRVEKPRELAEHVLGWDRQEIDDVIASGRNQEFQLETRIPVHLNYFTAWPDASGKIAFYNDIYNRDLRLEKALNTIAVAAN